MENLPSPCGLSGTLNEALTQIDSLKQKIAGGLDSIGDLGAIANSIKEKLSEIKVPEIPELDLQTELASLPYLSPAEYNAKIAQLKSIFGSSVENLDSLIDKIPKPPSLSTSSENLVEQLKNLAAGKLPDTQSIIDALTPESIANAISDMCKETPKVVVVITTDEDGNEIIGPVETKPEVTPTPTKNPEKEKAPSPPPASGFTFAFTKDKLEKAGGPAAAAWYDAFAITLPKYGITTPDRVAAFVAQIRVESGDFKALKENLNYKAKGYYAICANRLKLSAVEDCSIYLQTEKQTATGLYERPIGSSIIHNVAKNLGNVESGDGYKFIGRGLKQLTGRYNYTRASKDLYGDDRLVKNPDLVATDKQVALETACWFWSKNNLSAIADSWDITTLSKKVNGGTIGLDKRILYSDQARSIMKA
jgi:putative chitinase